MYYNVSILIFYETNYLIFYCTILNIISDIISQHQVEVSELQCLLRNTQERLQIEFQTSAEQVYNFEN